jgi:hypothetical protein
MQYKAMSFSIIIHCCQGGKLRTYDVESSLLLVFSFLDFFFFSSPVRQQFITLRNETNEGEKERERETKIRLLVFLVDGCLAFFKIRKENELKISEYSSNKHHFACSYKKA